MFENYLGLCLKVFFDLGILGWVLRFCRIRGFDKKDFEVGFRFSG